MDIKTVYGFIMVGAGFLFQAIAKVYGINGGIETAVSSLIAAGLFLIAGKEIYNKKVVG